MLQRNFVKKIFVVFLCLGVISGIVFYTHTNAASVNTSVTITICGNSITEGSETCDDGNTISGDGCSSICQIEVVEEEREGARTVPSSLEEVIFYTRVIFEGKAYPDALVNILKDGQFLTLLKADSKADFRTEIKDLTAGIYTFGFWAEDKNGLKSSNFTITFYVAPAVTTMVSGILLPPTVKISKDVLLRGESLNISGQAMVDGRVDLFISSSEPLKEVFQDSIITDSKGDWYYLFDTAKLNEGVYGVKAKAISKEGLLSIFSYALPFEITLVKPPVPPIPPELPKPPTPPVPGVYPSADLNKDNGVNFIDFSIMLYWWGRTSDYADLNGDGVVNLIDFSILMYYWTG